MTKYTPDPIIKCIQEYRNQHGCDHISDDLLVNTINLIEKQQHELDELRKANEVMTSVCEAAEELNDVADLRGDNGYLNPCDDPEMWTARRNDAWGFLDEALVKWSALQALSKEDEKPTWDEHYEDYMQQADPDFYLGSSITTVKEDARRYADQKMREQS